MLNLMNELSGIAAVAVGLIASVCGAALMLIFLVQLSYWLDSGGVVDRLRGRHHRYYLEDRRNGETFGPYSSKRAAKDARRTGHDDSWCWLIDRPISPPWRTP
jgi:hypothetical protein